MGKRNKKTKAIKIEKIRKYRKDKRIAKRPRIVITEDYGDMERTQILTLPTEYDREEILIPKEKNPNILYILQYPIKIVWYLDTHKGFFYTQEGFYLGKFDSSHLRRIFVNSALALRKLAKENKRKKSLKSKKKKNFSERFSSKSLKTDKNRKGGKNGH